MLEAARDPARDMHIPRWYREENGYFIKRVTKRENVKHVKTWVSFMEVARGAQRVEGGGLLEVEGVMA